MANLSNKISEKMYFEGDQILIKKTHDGGQGLRDAAYARIATDNSFGSDYKHVGNVDIAMLGVWLKEAGVQWTDTQAVKDVLKKKLMMSEFSGLRVWEGNY
tara:strand:+ start:136 stop:438 length:303 start_codon:yes stop_codon:yes gene_type:complete